MSNKITPKHYLDLGQYSPLHIIEVYQLDFIKGNIVKYLLRAGRKEGESELDDLKKAQWYLNRCIKNLEKVND